MELYILRHAIAVESGTPGYLDEDRPLTKEGIRKMESAAKGMKALDLKFKLFLSSPYLRAKQTAEITADVFDMKKKIEFTKHLIPEGSRKKLIKLLNEQYSSQTGIVLVGHEPYLSSLISKLLSGKSNLSIDLKKGSLTKLTIDQLTYGRCAALDWLMTSSQLESIA